MLITVSKHFKVLKMPVSGTHSIVGAVVGFALISKGVNAVQWMTIVKIVISWFASPVLSGVLAIGLYTMVSKMILQAENRVSRACTFLPIFYSGVVGFNCYSIMRTMNKSMTRSIIRAQFYLRVQFSNGAVAVAMMRRKNSVKPTLTLPPTASRSGISLLSPSRSWQWCILSSECCTFPASSEKSVRSARTSALLRLPSRKWSRSLRRS